MASALTGKLRETLAVFDGGAEPRTTPEVAEQLGLGRRSTYTRLERLVDAGRLETKKVGANARVWWRPPSRGAGSDEPEQFASLVDAVEEYAIFTLDPDGIIQTWNPGAERIKGYAAPEILGEHFSTFYTDADIDAGVPADNLATALEEGWVEDEGWRVRADGTLFWANVTITAIRDDDGELEGFAKVTRDMTQRREQEEELRQQRDFTQQILETVPVGVLSVDPDGTFTTANQRAVELLGLEDGDGGEYTVGINDVYDEDGEYLPPEDRPYISAFETGEPVRNWHGQIALPDGGRRWLSTNIEPVLDEDGSVERVVAAVEDISQLKTQANRLEQQRDQLESELAEVLGRITDAFYALDDGWRFTHINERAEELLDVTSEEIIGKHVSEVLDWDETSRLRAQLERAMASQDSASFEVSTADSRDAWYELHAYPSPSGLSVYFRDVTDDKRRERRLERYEHAVEQVWDGVTTLDSDYRFVMVNEAICEMSGYDRDELVGAPAAMLLDEAAYDEAGRLFEEVIAGDREIATLEYDLQTKGGGSVPVEARFGPCRFEDGTVGGTGVIRDISERKDREQRLELYETIVGTMEDGVYVLDEEYCFAEVNEAYAEMTGYDREELLGTHCTLVVDEDVTAESADLVDEMAAGDLDGASLEADLLRKDGTRLRAESNFAILPMDGDAEPRKVGVVRDVSDRVERERKLERALDLLHKTEWIADVAGWEIDPETGEPYWSAHLFDLLDVEYEEQPTLDDALDVYHTEADRTLVEDAIQDALERGESFDEVVRFPRPAGDIGWLRVWGEPEMREGDVVSFRGAVQDVTEQITREQELRDTKAQLEAATAAGGVGTWVYDVGADRFAPGEWFADVFGIEDDEGKRATLEEVTSAIHRNDRDRVETALDAAISSCGAFEEEFRVRDVDGELRWVVARGQVECDDDGAPIAFPGALTDVTSQKRTEFELKRQREELRALNDINEVVSEITAAVINQSTRTEIEQVVCDALAAADTYEFAWLAAVDANSRTLEPRATAGTDGYVDEIDISLEPGDPTGDGPGATAVRERETQVVQDVFDDPRFEPWRGAASQYGFSAVASIPIVHEETIYGVLALYADRENAFEPDERAVISQLGEVVGHAIAAADRKRALMSDELVELEFRIYDVFEAIGAPVQTEETITLDTAIPAGDSEFIVHGTAHPEALDAVAGLVEHLPHWESFTVRSEGDPATFELRLAEPPILSVVSDIGGYFEDFVVEDGDCTMTIHLAPTVEVRRVIDIIKSSYPTAEMVRRQQVLRPRDDPHRIQRRLVSDLTEKQRAALDAAYQSGYFEWPRDSPGEAIAESLGIAPATFSQHLRKAEQKVFDSLYDLG